MGFAFGEGEKPGEVTNKSQVLSPNQHFLPFSTGMCVFVQCFPRFSWCESVTLVVGTGLDPSGKGGRELLFFLIILKPLLCAEL